MGWFFVIGLIAVIVITVLLLEYITRDKEASLVYIPYPEIYTLVYYEAELKQIPQVKRQYEDVFNAMISYKTIGYRGWRCMVTGEKVYSHDNSRVFTLRRVK